MADFNNLPSSGESLGKSYVGGDTPINPAELARIVNTIVGLKEDFKEQKNWIVGGFVLLVFTAAAMVTAIIGVFIMVLLSWTDSNDRLLDKVDGKVSVQMSLPSQTDPSLRELSIPQVTSVPIRAGGVGK